MNRVSLAPALYSYRPTNQPTETAIETRASAIDSADPFADLPQPLREWLPAAVRRISAALDPETVMLFGSFARGSASRKSDIDLLIVWQTDEMPVERIGRVLKLLSDSPRAVEVVALTPRELDARRHSPFLRCILSEGRLLYERGETDRRVLPVAAAG